jgi:hypothetical protein
MCRGRQRLAGILKNKQEERRALFGAQGMVLVEYAGDKEGELPKTVYTGIRYPYYPGRRFYVDANDSSRVLSWKENGMHVFKAVDDGAGH